MTRPYAAERRSLRLHDWPQRDQELLARAIAPGGLLDDGGRGAAWMPKTYHGYVWTYGRWLTFLKLNLGSNLRDDPPERATRENLAAFIAILREQGVASSTIFDYLKGVYVMLWAMLPEHDWSWLRESKICQTPSLPSAPAAEPWIAPRARHLPTRSRKPSHTVTACSSPFSR